VRHITGVHGERIVTPAIPLVASWAGLRGAVSLAAALAIPLELAERDLIIFLTFVVILVTLVGQGLTLPLLLRQLGLADGGETQHEETHARTVSTEAALSELAQLRDRWPAHVPLIENLEERYRHRVVHLPQESGESSESDQERFEHRAILSAVIGAERESVIGLRDRAVISDEILRRIERELDLEELRLEADI
jgi:NhaP-type Na+/H+ or K+/H+ antiporter